MNVESRSIFCADSLDVMRGINSDCIDLIYLDPPFNKNKKFTAPAGSCAEGAGFSDILRSGDVKETWLYRIKHDNPALYQYLDATKNIGKPYNFPYLAYMAIRLLECHRILKQSGSIYLHCDPTMSHYLKTTMDCIFGEENFKNEIIWQRNPSHEDSNTYGKVSDTILFYGQPINKGAIRTKLNNDTIRKHYRHKDKKGRYRPENLKSNGLQGGGYTYLFKGHKGPWRCPEETMKKYEKENRIHLPIKRGGVPQRKRYLHEHPGIVPTNIWNDIKKTRGKEQVGYPTQKPLKLLERIILASSNENDIILDPFCGCATTCIAAEKLNRNWIGIDVSTKACQLGQARLAREGVTVRLRTDPPEITAGGSNYEPGG